MDPRRRFFLRGVAQPATARQVQRPPPRPPWSLADEAEFTTRCSRCGDCARACPRQLIHAGDGGFPELSLARQGCNQCGDCRQACHTGALVPATVTPQPPAFRWRVQVAASCLALHRVECRICAEACDTAALRCRPALGGIAQLQVDTALCTGCGDCLAPCPVAALSLALPGDPPPA